MMPAVAAALLAAGAAAASGSRPNVVFIMADDHAGHAISAHGSRVNETPNLDRLAREGMQTTVAKLLQDAGYHTGMIGKWHLGSDPTAFDRWEVLPGQGVYHDPVLYTATGETTYRGRYVTDVITDLGIDFVREPPKDRPFFLMLHREAPQREWTPDEKHRRMFETRVIPQPPTLWDDYATRTDALHENQQRVADDMTRRDLKLVPPPGLEGRERDAWLSAKPTEVTPSIEGKATTLSGRALARWKYQRYMQDYLACVLSIDDTWAVSSMT